LGSRGFGDAWNGELEVGASGENSCSHCEGQHTEVFWTTAFRGLAKHFNCFEGTQGMRRGSAADDEFLRDNGQSRCTERDHDLAIGWDWDCWSELYGHGDAAGPCDTVAESDCRQVSQVVPECVCKTMATKGPALLAPMKGASSGGCDDSDGGA